MARPARARWRAAALVALLATTAAPASASTEDVLELDADTAAREALRANRDREVALERIAIARGLLGQAGRWANPELEMSGGSDFAFSNEGESVTTLSFEQRFPVTAQLARQRDVARADLEIAEAEVREFERGLIADTLGAFYGMLSFERRIAVKEELVGLVRQLEGVSERRLRAAEVSRADVSLLRIERLRLLQQGARLGVERDALRLRLARLLGRSLDTPIRVRGDLEVGPPSFLELDPEGWTARRPDVRAATLAIARGRADEDLARAERWENWTLRTWVGRERTVFEEPIGTKADRLMGVDFVVPLPLWNRNQGRIAAAGAETRRAERARAALVLRAEEELRTAQARVATLRASSEVYQREVLPESTEALRLLDRGYRQGLIGIAELLQAQRQHAEVRDEYLELLGDLRRAQVELEAAAGRSPHLGARPRGGEVP